ncbi:hypothetical protein GQ53DRAFT_747133 [Thozetella sp. PMI_491]|nr:hypothetical protein GQ53DRAFT_747133 [Thozetella sp. PMI_491]
MGGLDHFKLRQDPAIVRLSHMIENRYKYFRWTPRTAWISFVYIVAVPATVGYLGYQQDGKWDLKAKLRGDVIAER